MALTPLFRLTTTTAAPIGCTTNSASPAISNPSYPSQSFPKLMRFGSFPFSKQSTTTRGQVVSALRQGQSYVCIGGREDPVIYEPEKLKVALSELDSAFKSLATDHEFQKELDGRLKLYDDGGERLVYKLEGLTKYYKKGTNGDQGPEIYMKREDHSVMGFHNIKNVVAQALLAKKLGKKRIVTETGAGQYGVAAATVCKHFGLECVIYMGIQDMERQALNMHRMMYRGAKVEPIGSGTATIQDATSFAIWDWLTNVETTHYMIGSAAGPHPYPTMVREFHAYIGKETRKQAMEEWGGKPDVLIACVDGDSNATGLFREFVEDKDVRLIGVEGGGFLLDSRKHAPNPSRKGHVHGPFNYLLQDVDGQIIDPLSRGLDYSGVGPKHRFLNDLERVELYSITDEEAMQAFKRMAKLEGSFPGLETSHALAYLEKLGPTIPNGTKVVVNFICNGSKDICTAFKYLRD